MNLLLVGALSWNPERIRSLHERGHRLWGLWSRTMAWEQGPYPCVDGCVTPVTLAEAARTIRERSIDCVYSLFQVYHRRLWAPPTSGIDHDVWTILRALFAARERGEFDAPIVRHWGFDVQQIDPAVARAFDGHVFCNREKRDYWTRPASDGGCGLSVYDECGVQAFLDGDRPKLEFMNDDFSERLSDRDGEVHTVAVGRPFGLDYIALARRGIHVHFHGNAYDAVWRTIARDLDPALARRHRAALAHHLHVHPSLQPTGADWEGVRRVKARWVREFSRYDAGWSYVGRPLPWAPLDDLAAIPNRVSTCLLAGLPVIADVLPGHYRYDEVARLGVAVDLVDYDGLRANLDDEVRTRTRSDAALRARAGYSFDASIDALVRVFERARDAYFAKPAAERTRFEPNPRRIVHFAGSADPVTVLCGLATRAARPPVATPGDAPRASSPFAHLGRELAIALGGAARARRIAATIGDGAVQPTPAAGPRSAPAHRDAG